ncbi:MAG: S9 family peptidase [Candidatus Solibacter sp.]|nr:S9 family peptidase [Candidatus Solibacter sp.]
MGRTTILFLFAAACFAQAPTAEQALSFKSPGMARISPDGTTVVYSVREADWEQNEFVSQLWIAPVSGGAPYQLTRGKSSAGNPQWSPDSKRIAFSTSRDGKGQIWLIPPTGGEAVALTNEEASPGGFKWSPDGKRIAFTSAGPEPKDLKDRKERYGDFEIYQQDYRQSHLWVVDVPEEIPTASKQKPKATAITSGTEYSVGGFEWSPDGLKIAFSASKSPLLIDVDTSDIYTVGLADKAVKKIIATAGPDSNPVWSPDGKQIAFSTANADPFFFYKNGRIGVVAADGGSVQIVAGEVDEDIGPAEWGKDGIYFSAWRKLENGIHVVQPGGKARRLFEASGVSFMGASLSKDEKLVAAVAARANEYPEVYVLRNDPQSARIQKITSFAGQYAKHNPANREVVRWKSSDGVEIEGILTKPADFDPSKKYPLLVVIHGGPTGIDTPIRRADSYYPIERFAAKGAVILQPNYRGSAGYGEKFRSLNVRNLGVGDAWDVLSGVDYLISRGFVDESKLGSMGWSQGGYISAFLTTNTSRFKAISVGAGISDWMTYYVNTDITPFTRQYLHATPWDDPAIYARTSPITNIRQAKTPTLIQHGENDKRVPIPNGYQLYQGLKDVGVEARFVIYKGFGHGITKPKQLRHVQEDNERWFLKHVWGEEMKEPAVEESKPEAKPDSK